MSDGGERERERELNIYSRIIYTLYFSGATMFFFFFKTSLLLLSPVSSAYHLDDIK